MNDKALQGALLIIGLIMILREQQKPRGIRNNNPLNIRENGTKWKGKVGDDGEFTQFKSPEMGIRAAARILRNYRNNYGLTTVYEIISRWAPSVENDTTSYIESVAVKLGIDKNEQLLSSDYPQLIEAMILQENGQQPYSSKIIKSGFKQGFYT